MSILLSIITPYYNTLKYTKRLAETLVPQLTEEVEWIIVDDGSHDKELDKLKAKVIHLETNSGGASHPRNVGIESSIGEYITFIDSDDEVLPNYINAIINKIKNDEFDYCYFGWRTKDSIYMIEEEPPEWNHSVWNCLYKRSLIGDNRFNENYYMNEDGLFNENVRKGKRDNILEILYFYNWNVRDDNISSLYRDNKIPLNKE